MVLVRFAPETLALWVVHTYGFRFWIGYLEEYPDYVTQGESLQELQEHLRDLYADLWGGHIPAVRKVAELELA